MSTKIETDYPIMDTLIHNGKILMMGTILKDEDEVGKYETLDISRTGDMYVQCIRGVASFNMFNYTKAQLNEIGLTSNYDYVYHGDIPSQYRKSLLKIAIRDYIANYEEQNNYYRTFCGLPPLEDNGIYITEQVIGVNNTKPIHKMSKTELNILEGLGILDKYRNLYPDCMYLNFLGSASIDPYLLRTLPKFGVIYMPTEAVHDIRTRYREKIEIARTYAITCLYTNAMLYKNDYYNNFIAIFIKVRAMCDLIMDVPDMIIRKDVFDLRTVKYMFESSGIKYFEEIPLKYQLAMLKNMNTLLTFKSTTKNMIDICSLFGFKNVNLFKYYLLRSRKIDEGTGEFLFDTTTELNPNTGKYETVDDYVNNFELKFIKVPIDGILDNYIRDDNNYVSYEDMTKDDLYWSNSQNKDDVYKEIISREFNIERSKYISIDTIYEMDKLTFEMSYFFNIILDDVFLEENLNLKIYKISNLPIVLKHAIMYLYLLNYEQYGLEDKIISDTSTKVLSVYGFNFKADLTKIAEYLRKNHVSADELGIANFTLPNQILTYNQLLDVYKNNKKVYDHIVYQMTHANDYQIYKIYEDLYNALMITDISHEIYKLPTGDMASTYTEYFLYYNIDIYNHIQNIRSLDGKDKENAIGDTIVEILSCLEDYIQTDEFEYMFMNLPMVGEIVKDYIYKVINFYKSYKIQLDKINTIYRFDDMLENRIKMIDGIWINGKFSVEDYNLVEIETLMVNALVEYKDSVNITDSIDIGYGLTFDDIDTDFPNINREELYIKGYLIPYDDSTLMFNNKLKCVNSKLSLHDNFIMEDFIEIS